MPNEQAVVHAAPGASACSCADYQTTGRKVIALTSSETKGAAARTPVRIQLSSMARTGRTRLEFNRKLRGRRCGLRLVGATLDASLRVTRKGGQVVFGMAGGDPARSIRAG